MRSAPSRMSWRTPAGTTRLLEFGYLLRPPGAGFRTAPQPTPGERRTLALSFARAVHWFHTSGIVLDDISHANVLWTLGPEPGVHFLDCDGFGFAGGPATQPRAETPDWTDPRTPHTHGADIDSDAYKTALAIGRIVSQDPYVVPGQPLEPVAGCLDDRYAATVRRPFAEAAGERGTRPPARKWCDALHGDTLTPPDAGQPPLARRLTARSRTGSGTGSRSTCGGRAGGA
ncbi:hypothetical protein [Streptomyces sp. NPDC001568]|uniref:hypothetical protein n=1 Tax=Streptomyces sp. NPDC001568 TaxID=3364588 RepID=UPI0036B7F6AC